MMPAVGTGLQQQHAAAGRCTGMRSSVVAFARFGRAPSLGDGSSSREGSGLIIPGGRDTRRSGDRDNNGAERKLILPNQGPGARGAPPTAPGRRSVVEDVNANQLGLSQAVATNVAPAPTSMNKFRPPPGFMDDTSMTTDADILAMDPQDMLNKLRSRAQLWHELCKYIPVLYNRGYDSSSLDELTGLTSLDQNRWVVAGSVFDSLKTSGQVPRSVLDRFNQGGDELLYPFRFLSVQRRITAAEYILEQGFDPEMCDVLARAMKEYERRVTDRVGFTDHPADCLAYKYMRDAIETREAREKRAKFDLALEVVLSDEGRQRILDLMAEKKKEERTSKAIFNILRLSRDDIGYRPMAVAGSLTQATAADVMRVSRATQEGAFGTFSFVGAGAETTSWVALPQWRALALARYPVALTIPDCSVNQDIVAAAGAKSTEDMRRLQGPAMVVVDRDPQGGLQEPSEEQWYLTADGPGGRLRVQDGAAVIASGTRAVAAVLFLCRPPVREVENKGTDMLQL